MTQLIAEPLRAERCYRQMGRASHVCPPEICGRVEVE